MAPTRPSPDIPALSFTFAAIFPWYSIQYGVLGNCFSAFILVVHACLALSRGLISFGRFSSGFALV
jgi:hypothetical protein